MISKTLGVATTVASTPVVTSPGVSSQSSTIKPSVAPTLLDTPIKASPVMTTTAQSSRIVADTPTAASSQPILTPDAGTATSKPVSTAAVPETPAAAASTAPIVIVRQLKEVRPYDRKTSCEIVPRTFRACRKGQSVDHQGRTSTAPCVGTDGTGS